MHSVGHANMHEMQRAFKEARTSWLFGTDADYNNIPRFLATAVASGPCALCQGSAARDFVAMHVTRREMEHHGMLMSKCECRDCYQSREIAAKAYVLLASGTCLNCADTIYRGEFRDQMDCGGDEWNFGAARTFIRGMAAGSKIRRLHPRRCLQPIMETV